ncbi:hypothetical protein GQ600_1903 [Phytophthora cactorum]|nr:hypothetical protein GQ600_1903 [Phytophthora cactorum]
MTVEKRLPDSSCKPFRLSESVVRTALETIEKVIPLNEAMDLTNSQSASEDVDAQFKDDGAAEIAEKMLSSWPCARLEALTVILRLNGLMFTASVRIAGSMTVWSPLLQRY